MMALLRLGIKWETRNGELIDVWKDRWVCDMQGVLQDYATLNTMVEKVKDLMHPITK